MTVFLTTLEQLGILFGFMIIGFILGKTKILPKDTAKVLSTLENNVFVPGLVLGTFAEKFTVESLAKSGELMGISSVITIIVIPLAFLFARFFTKDKYLKNIYTYGFIFANFGFMGNSLVLGLYGADGLFDYLVFTLPPWILIYVWAVPFLLMSDTEHKQTFKETMKKLFNPMFIAILLGMAICLLGIHLPKFLMSVINTAGSCMSPVAMILTGFVVSTISLKKAFASVKIYLVSLIRLVVFPLLFIGISAFFKLPQVATVCAVCQLSMPLGLNTIVVPAAYGKDTSVAASLAVISHLLSIVTIPLMFALAT